MKTKIKDFKIEIKITSDDSVIWSEYSSGNTQDIASAFDSAEVALGSMQRNLERVLERDYPETPEKEEQGEETPETVDAVVGVGSEKNAR